MIIFTVYRSHFGSSSFSAIEVCLCDVQGELLREESEGNATPKEPFVGVELGELIEGLSGQGPEEKGGRIPRFHQNGSGQAPSRARRCQSPQFEGYGGIEVVSSPSWAFRLRQGPSFEDPSPHFENGP